MTAPQTVRAWFSRWLDDAASAVTTLLGRMATTGAVRLVEGEAGQLTVETGVIKGLTKREGARLEIGDGRVLAAHPPTLASALRDRRVDLVLCPDRFLFKPLELPSRATEFLVGVVRAQIDRLTPWNAAQAAFGCSAPADAGGGRIVVTVAATGKSALAPFVQAMAGLGVRSITVSTPLPDATPESTPITVLEQHLGGLDVRNVRRAMLATLVAGGLVAATVVTAATIIGDELRAQQDDIARRIAERRSALIVSRKADDPATAAERSLAQRKNETPASVLVIEALSQMLPDHTYVTELRIEGNLMRISGMTSDAPSLIRLIEQSPHFSRATFFAPTTRAPSETRDRYHIEARILPVFTAR